MTTWPGTSIPKSTGNASATNGSLFAAQPVAYGIRTANTSSNGWGIQEECTHTLDCAQGVAVAQAVCYAIQAGALRTNPASGPDGIGVQADHAYTLEARAEVQVVAFAQNSRNEVRLEGGDGQRCGALSTGGGKPAGPATDDQIRGVPRSMAVRRLLPEECEKLQGFEPGYTAIPWRGKPASECPDGPRYKSLGNSWAVPVAAWVGKRIQELENGRK